MSLNRACQAAARPLLAMPLVFAIRGLTLLGLLMCLTAVMLHVPGQISMDTSVQLFEAHSGHSVSWNPPFMSALLRWLGGGELSTSLIVLINCTLTYGALTLTARSLLIRQLAAGEKHVASWRVLLCGLLLMNPIVFVYVGIVWKDVLFATLLAGSAAGTLVLANRPVCQRPLYTAVILVLLSAAFMVRQQGVFMAPVLLCGVWFASCHERPIGQKATAACMIALAFIFALWVLKNAVDSTLEAGSDRLATTGYRSVMVYDLAGIVNNSPKPSEQLVLAVSAQQQAAIRRVYTPTRVDYLSTDPIAATWPGPLSTSDMAVKWWAMLKQNPRAYLQHKAQTYGALLGFYGVKDTLPVHIGVEGNSAYLQAVDIPAGRHQRNLMVYSIASTFFNWPIYRHAFWLLMLIVSSLALAKAKIARVDKTLGLIFSGATALLYLSYLLVSLAADFRYLYGAMPLVMLLGLIWLLSPRASPAARPSQSAENVLR